MKQCTGMALLGLMATSALGAQSSIYVGMTEHYVVPEFQEFAGQSHREKVLRPASHLRLAFVKDDSGWWPINKAVDPPERMAWHVAFSGRELGMIETRPPEGGMDRSGDKRFALDFITPAEKVPHVKLDKRGFYSTSGALQSWPLAAVSAPNVRDPDHWKPTKLTRTELGLVLKEFRAQVPKKSVCRGPEDLEKVVDYVDSDVTIAHAYRARDGRVIAGMLLEDITGCGFFDDSTFYSYWYALDKDGSIRLFGDEMTPIDAIDLDGDGESEWLFKAYKGCATGYRLYADRLRTEINSW